MRFAITLFLVSSLASLVLAAFGTPSAPHSDFVMSGVIVLAPPVLIPNPLGGRVSISFTGGNFTNSEGNVFATVVPGAGGDNGVVDSAGFFHLDARITVKLVDESNTYAYLQVMGIGKLVAVNNFYMTIETNSTKYNFLNQVFAWGNATISGPYLLADIFSPTKLT